MGSKSNTKGVLIASAVAGLMVAGSMVGTAFADDADTDVKCYGVNECKGQGSCGGEGHACAGNNECKGQGYLKMSKEACLALEGGRLTPAKEEG